MRTFLALNLPLNIKQDIFNLYSEINNSNIKWTSLNNLHITLKFIGEIEENQLAQLRNFLGNNLKLNIINLKIKDTIFFPKFGPPKIIALLGIIDKETNQQINQFLKKLNSELKFIPLDQRSFTPHITLGRIKNFIQKENYQFNYQNNCQINTIDLMQSSLTPTGPIYKIVESYNLTSSI